MMNVGNSVPTLPLRGKLHLVRPLWWEPSEGSKSAGKGSGPIATALGLDRKIQFQMSIDFAYDDRFDLTTGEVVSGEEITKAARAEAKIPEKDPYLVPLMIQDDFKGVGLKKFQSFGIDVLKLAEHLKDIKEWRGSFAHFEMHLHKFVEQHRTDFPRVSFDVRMSDSQSIVMEGFARPIE